MYKILVYMINKKLYEKFIKIKRVM